MQIRTLQIKKRTSTTAFIKVASSFTTEPHAVLNIVSSNQSAQWANSKNGGFSSEQCVTVTVTRHTISDADNNRWPTADQLVFFVLPWLFVLPWQLWATVQWGSFLSFLLKLETSKNCIYDYLEVMTVNQTPPTHWTSCVQARHLIPWSPPILSSFWDFIQIPQGNPKVLRANVSMHQTNSGKSPKFVFPPTFVFCSPICSNNCVVFW